MEHRPRFGDGGRNGGVVETPYPRNFADVLILFVIGVILLALLPQKSKPVVWTGA